jgi:hypothetical protein
MDTKEALLQVEPSNKRKNGGNLKGCDSGVKKHGMNITNSRSKDEMLKMDSMKYLCR